MKHEGEHKLDFACLGCVRKHIEHKEKLLQFVKKISEESSQDDYKWIWLKAQELSREIEADHD